MPAGDLYEYSVLGNASFPLDMLRYDRCWPADPAAVDGLSVAVRDSGRDAYFRGREVRLRSTQAPTIGRWNSFGWNVSEHLRVTSVRGAVRTVSLYAAR